MIRTPNGAEIFWYQNSGAYILEWGAHRNWGAYYMIKTHLKEDACWKESAKPLF